MSKSEIEYLVLNNYILICPQCSSNRVFNILISGFSILTQQNTKQKVHQFEELGNSWQYLTSICFMVLNVIRDFNLDHESYQFDGTTNIKPTYVEEPGEEVVVTMI